MRILRHYTQFRGLTEEEVNAGLREQAAERRRAALARVDALDLSRLTWPEMPHPDIVAAITFAARRGLHRDTDPEAGPLRAALARRHGLDASRIVVGAGASQLLEAALHALVEPGDEVVTPWPSYGLYPLAARASGGAAVPVPGFGAEAVLAAVTDRTRVVCLCNPNDPTGDLLDAGALRDLVEALPQRVALLVDEALRDFVDAEDPDATLDLLDDHPRVLLFRSFSKAWGLAGVRCGYALGGPGAEELLGRLAPPRGVDELAQAGCLEAVEHHGELPERRRARVAGARERLVRELAARDVHAPPSQTNALWLPLAGERVAALERARILAWPGAQVGAPDRVRLSVPVLPGAMERVLRALDVPAS